MNTQRNRTISNCSVDTLLEEIKVRYESEHRENVRLKMLYEGKPIPKKETPIRNKSRVVYYNEVIEDIDNEIQFCEGRLKTITKKKSEEYIRLMTQKKTLKSVKSIMKNLLGVKPDEIDNTVTQVSNDNEAIVVNNHILKYVKLYNNGKQFKKFSVDNTTEFIKVPTEYLILYADGHYEIDIDKAYEFLSKELKKYDD